MPDITWLDMKPPEASGATRFATIRDGLTAARAACEAGALSRAQVIWDAVHDRFDRPARFWRRLVDELRQAGLAEAAEALLSAMARWFGDGRIYLELATIATDRGDWMTAARRWAAVRAFFPDDARACFAEAHALRRCGRFAEAAALAAAGERRFADQPEPMIDRAVAAEDLRDGPAALLAWERARQSFPDHAPAHIGGMTLLLEMGRMEEAESLALEAMQRFPEHAGITALRWRVFRARHPEDHTGYEMEAAALIAGGRPEEADALLHAALPRFPDRFRLMVQWMMIAVDRQDPAEAIQRAEQLRRGFPERARGYLEGVAALRKAHRLEEAETLATDAALRFPENPWIAMENAQVAQDREDWPMAISRWQHVRGRFPDNRRGFHGLTQALASLEWQVAAGGVQEAAALAATAVTDEGQTEAAALRGMFMQFEGLGDNCELGQVQRRHGAEPLGLLRWGGLPTRALIAALDNDFEDFTDPANFVLSCAPGQGEYYLRVPKATFRMHTFIREGETPYEKLLQQTTRRLLFLRDKLLSDLRDGEKIFVHKPSDGLLPEELIDPLFAALRRHGPGTLFCVRLADADHPAGSVEMRRPGLMVGYLDRVSPAAVPAEISFECWLTLCGAAAQIHVSVSAAAAVEAR